MKMPLYHSWLRMQIPNGKAFFNNRLTNSDLVTVFKEMAEKNMLPTRTITQNLAVWKNAGRPGGKDKPQGAIEAEKDKKEGVKRARHLAYFSLHSIVWNVFGGRSCWERMASSARVLVREG